MYYKFTGSLITFICTLNMQICIRVGSDIHSVGFPKAYNGS